jgi:hypothetical protein
MIYQIVSQSGNPEDFLSVLLYDTEASGYLEDQKGRRIILKWMLGK